MSVFPEFIQHIHDMGLYEAGYNYEEMYNIMIYNLTYNIISTNNFIYTYSQINMLYDYLEELLGSNQEDSDVEVEIETNVDPIYPVNNINTINQNIPNTNTSNTNDINQDAIQLLNNYIINAINNATQNNLYANINPMNNMNSNTNTNNNTNTTNEDTYNNEFTYTNLIYYNNT